MLATPIKYLIVDDNNLDALNVEVLASQHAQLQGRGTFHNALEALSAIKAIKPDLVFLDVEMPDCSGVELLKAIREDVPMAVFITSYPEFALEGFELSALDYILKPATEERFEQCIRRVLEYWEMLRKSQAYDVSVAEETITIKQGHEQIKLALGDIIYLEAMNDYTKLVLQGKQYMTLINLTRFLAQLPPQRFVRIHRSYAVASDKIVRVAANDLYLKGDFNLPVSKTYRKELRNKIV